jgi:hypothetical protein
VIDHPQRFGPHAYERLDPGQSTLRFDLPIVAFGFSTANEYWGPAAMEPIILGNNAAGFPHVFAGTSRALELGPIRVHGRVIWGRLEQSPYSVVQGADRSRFGSGAAGSLSFRGLPGLEIGAARFLHQIWPREGLRSDDYTRVFTLHNFAAAKANLAAANGDPTNQLASLFMRWVFPTAGLEVYGEFGRDDYNLDVYDLISEPDHISSYMVGLQRVWTLSGNRALAFRAEMLNSRITHLATVRGEEPFYVHRPIYQGHTVRGQILGAPDALGGGGSELGVDLYSESGRTTVELTRQLVEARKADVADVVNALGVERTWFGRTMDVRAAVTGMVELNRRPTIDVGNVNVRLGAAFHW